MRNAEGYKDPTASDAVLEVGKDEKAKELKIKNMIAVFRYIAKLNGFVIGNRIEFKDENGRTFR